MEKGEWEGRVGDLWAAEWKRTDRSFAALQQDLLTHILAEAGEGARVLDVGCGAGATSIALAKARPDCIVRGIDVSPALIEIAAARHAAANCRFEVADAAVWEDAAFRPDLIVSRHGVMFFADPVAAFSHLGAVASDRARLVFSCFRAPELNPWASGLAALLPAAPAVDPAAPGPFAFADEARVRGILSAAGWHDAQCEPLDYAYVAGAGEDPVADALDYLQRIGPAARALRDLDETARKETIGRMREFLCNHLRDGAVSMNAAAAIWTAGRNMGKQ